MPPNTLNFSHLSVALLPDDVGPDSADDYYGAQIARIDRQTLLADRWGIRIDSRPVPPQPASLADLVQAARERLRRDRLRDDRDELDARRFVLERVRTVLAR